MSAVGLVCLDKDMKIIKPNEYLWGTMAPLVCVYHSKALNNWLSYTITAPCEIRVPHLLSKSQTLIYSYI